ncbi:MAG: peptidoglycan editing factor PgeF [Bacteroidaceae bacterium]|nr:peptidoglycan editing factor PgeF [Bacteroidaceae bacterium]
MKTKNDTDAEVVPQLLGYDFGTSCVTAFSTKRSGGVSTGNYGSFNANFYSGDNPSCVIRNREILASHLGIPADRIIVPHQTHSNVCRVIDDKFLVASPQERTSMLEGVDAVMTNERDVCICVSTADCVPVLICDAVNNAVAAVHAGWRGTQKRIVVEALSMMEATYGTSPSTVKVVVGPCISLESFEVGNDVYSAFQESGFPMPEIAQQFPSADGGVKWHINLPLANSLLLQSEGVPADNIQNVNVCTYMNYEEFFSARRLGVNSGRILNGIMLG